MVLWNVHSGAIMVQKTCPPLDMHQHLWGGGGQWTGIFVKVILNFITTSRICILDLILQSILNFNPIVIIPSILVYIWCF